MSVTTVRPYGTNVSNDLENFKTRLQHFFGALLGRIHQRHSAITREIEDGHIHVTLGIVLNRSCNRVSFAQAPGRVFRHALVDRASVDPLA